MDTGADLAKSYKFLRSASFAGVLALFALTGSPEGRAQVQTKSVESIEATIPQLQAALTDGAVTSRDLVSMYLARIDAYDQKGPALNAISVKNQNALAEADTRDAERRARAQRGPL